MKELEKLIIGKGEKRGWKLHQVAKEAHGYIYECTHPEILPHYEVFTRKENTQFNCISYPSAKSFGIWAWTFPTFEQAFEKLQSLKPKEQ